MGNLNIVTGHTGEAHVSAVDARNYNYGTMFIGDCVLPVNERFGVDIIDATNLNVNSGDGVYQGTHFRINSGEVVSLSLAGGISGYNRNDLIVAQYSKDDSGIDSMSLVVMQGAYTEADAEDPSYVTGDVRNGEASLSQFPLWRIPIIGLEPQEPEQLFKVASVSELVNTLTADSTTPTDSDYYVAQAAGGGTTATTYHRRPLSALWSYIKGKISSVLGLSEAGYKASNASYPLASASITCDIEGANIDLVSVTGAQIGIDTNSYYNGDGFRIFRISPEGQYTLMANMDSDCKLSINGNAETATAAQNAQVSDNNYPFLVGSQGSDSWSTVPVIGNDGAVEVGRFVDFHITDASTSDYDTRIEAGINTLNLWGATIENTYLNALAYKAKCDGEGSIISDTYLKLSGGTMNGILSTNAIKVGDTSSDSYGWIDIYYNGAANTNLFTQSDGLIIRNVSDSSNEVYLAVKTYIDTNSFMRATDFVKSSSRLVKKNIKSMDEKEARNILKLRPVTFDYKNEGNGTNRGGLIAEEVEEILPRCVVIPKGCATTEDELNEGQTNVPSIDYANFVPYLIKMIQSHEARINAVEKMIEGRYDEC